MGDWILLPGTRAMNFAQQAPEAVLRDAVTAVGEVPEPALAAAASRHTRSVLRLEWRNWLRSNTCGHQYVRNFPDRVSGVCEFAPLVLPNCPALCTAWMCSTGRGRRRSWPRQTRLQRGARTRLISTRCGAPGAGEPTSLESKRCMRSAKWGGPSAVAVSCSVVRRHPCPGERDRSSSSTRGATSDAQSTYKRVTSAPLLRRNWYVKAVQQRRQFGLRAFLRHRK